MKKLSKEQLITLIKASDMFSEYSVEQGTFCTFVEDTDLTEYIEELAEEIIKAQK